MKREALQWRDSMRSPRLYFIDVRLLLMLLVWVFWPRLATLVPALIAIVFLVVVGYRGYRPWAALRAVRRSLAGTPRALSPRRYRRMLDYGALAAVAIFGLGLSPQEGAAAFLYIPPEQVEVPTLALASPSDDAAELVSLPVGDRSAVVMQVPKDRVPAGEETIAGAEDAGAEAAARTVAPGAGGAGAADGAGTAVEPGWEVPIGSTLGQVLREWGERAGVEILMLTDREYEIGSRHVFRGDFVDAVRALLFGLGDLPYAPVAQVLDGGAVLAVHHRVPGGLQEAGS